MATLSLSDLNDYLGPSQVCIIPIQEDNKPDPSDAATEIVVEQGAYYEQSKGVKEPPKKLRKAEITLNDCLACSGCITSAESVLVAQQSHEEVYKVLRDQPELTPVISISPQSIASLAAYHDIPVIDAFNALRNFFKSTLTFALVFDTTFARSLSLQQGSQECLQRYQSNKGKEKAEPILASACPGWICYAEKTQSELLHLISTVKSPQQIMGTLVKEYIAPQLSLSRDQIYHVAVMPCYDKKLEASRPDFAVSENRDVDCVLTTGEVLKMIQEHDINFVQLSKSSPSTQQDDSFFPSFLSHQGSSSGGYLHNAVRSMIRNTPPADRSSLRLEVKPIRGEDYTSYTLYSSNAPVYHAATCYGFRNLQNVVRKVGGKGRGLKNRVVARRKPAEVTAPERDLDFVEVMACPSGCVNGGGQITIKHVQDAEGLPIVAPGSERTPFSSKDWVANVESKYWQIRSASKPPQTSIQEVHESISPFLLEDAIEEAAIQRILAGLTEKQLQEWFHTSYRAIETEVNGLAVQW